MDDDRIAGRDVRHRRPDLLDPTRVLVTQGVRQLGVEGGLELALEDVQVGAADPGARDADDDVERSGHRRLGNLDELDRLAVADDLRGLHRARFLPVFLKRRAPVWYKNGLIVNVFHRRVET